MRVNFAGRAFVVCLAIIAASPFVAPAFHAAAQSTPGQAPGIVATGYGRVSGQAALAEVQVLIGQNYYYGGMGYSMDIETGMAAADASPVATDEPAIYPGGLPMMPSRLTEEDLTPFIDAVTAAGVAREGIKTIIPASASSYTGPSGLGGAQLRFSVIQPNLDDLSELVGSLTAIVSPSGASVEHIGVHYVGGDCASLQQAARMIAIADAQERAGGLAAGLGVSLGELVQAADGVYFGPYGDGSCDPSTSDAFGPYGPGMLQAFDASVPAEAVVYAQVTLTYALGPAAES